MKCNIFILKCFLQFTCSNLDDSQKQGGNFKFASERGGSLRKGGVPIQEEAMINNIYEDEKWLGNIVNKKANQICVHCLEKPYGVYVPQNLEREEDAVFFEQVFYTDVAPILSQIDANGKKGHK